MCPGVSDIPGLSPLTSDPDQSVQMSLVLLEVSLRLLVVRCLHGDLALAQDGRLKAAFITRVLSETQNGQISRTQTSWTGSVFTASEQRTLQGKLSCKNQPFKHQNF